jgi:hypothetical protein
MKVRARSSAAFRVEAFGAARTCTGAEWERTVMGVPEGLSVGRMLPLGTRFSKTNIAAGRQSDAASPWPGNQFPGLKLDHRFDRAAPGRA